MDILNNPLVLALFALFAIPGFTSGLAGVLKSIESATGIPSRVWVYVASLVVTGLIVFMGGVDFPQCVGDPAMCVGAWLTWATVNAEMARRLYEAVFERLTES